MAHTNLHVAFLGTRGIPAQYGGFETAVEHLATRLVSQNVQVTVYGNKASNANSYQGVRLVAMSALKSRSFETISRTALSVMHTLLVLRPDVVILMNSANAPLISLLKLFRIPVIAHLDGQEWLRPKWAGLRARYSLWANGWAARKAHAVIADNLAIKSSLDSAYKINSHYIPYGWQITTESTENLEKLFHRTQLPVRWKKYHLVVARWEQENHVLEALQAFCTSHTDLDLVVIGTQGYRDSYSEAIEELAVSNSRIHLMGSIWDKDVLAALYLGAVSYIHGHSVGGTNPSLLHAIGAQIRILAFDCTFNRSVAGDTGSYWMDVNALTTLLNTIQGAESVSVPDNFSTTFDWDSCASSLLNLITEVTQKSSKPNSRNI